jgi:hypothetical protein
MWPGFSLAIGRILAAFPLPPFVRSGNAAATLACFQKSADLGYFGLN